MGQEKVFPRTFKYRFSGEGDLLIHNEFPSKFSTAFNIAIKTSAIRELLLSFMSKGENLLGKLQAQQNGKYSDYKIIITAVDATVINNRYWIDYEAEAFFRAEVNAEGILVFYFYFDPEYDVAVLLENIVHEFTIHGYKIEEIIKYYEKDPKNTQSFINSLNANYDHYHLREQNVNHPGYKLYDKCKREINLHYYQFSEQFNKKADFYNSETGFKNLSEGDSQKFKK